MAETKPQKDAEEKVAAPSHYNILGVPKHQFQGFLEFIREQGVVGLGVGFVVGTSASTLVKSIVTNIFNPIIGVAFGTSSLNQKTICLKQGAKVCTNVLNYGQVVSDFITFLLVLLLVYVVIRGMKFEKIDKKKQ